MSYVPQAPSGPLFSVAHGACPTFQKAVVLEEAFFSDLRCRVAKPILPEAGLALPEQGGILRVVIGRSWLNPLLSAGGRDSVQTPQLHVWAPVAWGWSRPCWGPQGGGPAALTQSSPCHCTPPPPHPQRFA